MNILLIGHRGYLGRGMAAELRLHHKVVGWDVQEDIFKLGVPTLTRERIDLVINLSVAADRNSTTYQIETNGDRVNVGGARHLSKILAGTDITWIQMSTREVLSPTTYGPEDVIETPTGYRPKFLVGEDVPYAPRNSYGKSKLMAEFVSESHARSVVVRLTTGYTDFDREGEGNWMIQVIRNLLAGKPAQLSRGGLQFRDPLHVEDLSRLCELLHEKQVFLERIHAGGGAQNLVSLLEFVKLVAPNARVEATPGGDFGFAFDNTKAHRLTGWEPRVLVRDRLPIMVENVRLKRTQKIETTS